MARGDDPVARAVALHEAAIAARLEGRFHEGERACREAVTILESSEGPQSADLANALIEHGRLLERLDRLTEAETALQRAGAILASILAPAVRRLRDESGLAEDDAALIADELRRLSVRAELARAGVVRATGRLAEAEAVARRALADAESAFSEGDHLVAEALNTLGMIHKFQGRYGEAEPLYQRALAVAEALGDVEAQATLLHNVGGLCHARGDFAGGEPPARRAVELREAHLGPDHPATAADREAWGALLEGLGRLPEAEQAYTSSLATFEAHQGPQSLEAASSLAALGSVQHAQGRLDEALASYRRALAIRQARLPPQHFDLALTMNNLAMLLEDRGARSEARQLLERALGIFTTALGADHPHTEAVRKNMEALAKRS
jgi:tetratricopeptide (TPR) repeat protein